MVPPVAGNENAHAVYAGPGGGDCQVSTWASTSAMQAPVMTIKAANWMLAAVRDLDERFGLGYAERNPSPVAAMVQAASADQHFQ